MTTVTTSQVTSGGVLSVTVISDEQKPLFPLPSLTVHTTGTVVLLDPHSEGNRSGAKTGDGARAQLSFAATPLRNACTCGSFAGTPPGPVHSIEIGRGAVQVGDSQSVTVTGQTTVVTSWPSSQVTVTLLAP